MLLFLFVWKGKIYEKGNLGVRKVLYFWIFSLLVNLK